jgi:hypothetical protein
MATASSVVDLEAELNLSALDGLPAQMLTLYATYSEYRNRQVENPTEAGIKINWRIFHSTQL